MIRVAVIVLLLTGIVNADPQNMPLSVAAGGAAFGTSDLGHSLRGTLGQVVVHHAQSASGTLASGFWPGRRFAVPLNVLTHDIELPREFSFDAPYPNPFNPSTTLSFSLPHSDQLKLELFDITGRSVATLAEGKFEFGRHSLNWNAAHFASGIYFARLQTGGLAYTQKLHLIK